MDPVAEFVLGGLGTPDDSAHLIWYILDAVPLSDGRVAMLAPMGDHKVLVFESSGRLSASFGRRGRGPGEFRNPLRIQILPGDTIAVWDQAFGPVYYFGPSGILLRERRIDLGSVIAATRTSGQRPGESVHQPLPDGSFLVEVAPSEWRPPAETGVIYRRPTTYLRIDSAYSAHAFGWWGGRERLTSEGLADPWQVPFAAGSMTAAGGNPLAIYVTDGHRYEVHQFSATGILQRIIRRAVDPVPVSDEELNGWKESAGSVNRHWDWRNWDRAMSELPERQHPAIGNLHLDAEGYLWIRRLNPERGWGEWSVFNPEGRWLGTLVVPMLAVYWIGEDFILGGHINVETGAQTVERYRLNRRGRS